MTPDADDIIRTQLTEPLTELVDRHNATLPDDWETADEVLEDAQSLPLSLEVERTVRLVLCTGGPHLEVRIAERGGIEHATVYAVWGTTSKERGLTRAEADAVERFYGADVDYLLGEGQ